MADEDEHSSLVAQNAGRYRISPGLGPDTQWDFDRRRRDLESQGVVAAVVFPNGVPFQSSPLDDSGQAATPEMTRAGKMIYNRWLADVCSDASRSLGRPFIPVATMPPRK